MKKSNEKLKYELDEYVGTLKESDNHSWKKAVIRISWGDNPTTLDIRKVNMEQNRIGSGISLTNEETDRLVDILVSKDYGSMDELKQAIKRKESIYSIMEPEPEDDKYYTITGEV